MLAKLLCIKQKWVEIPKSLIDAAIKSDRAVGLDGLKRPPEHANASRRESFRFFAYSKAQ
jgi:hypothetical protein